MRFVLVAAILAFSLFLAGCASQQSAGKFYNSSTQLGTCAVETLNSSNGGVSTTTNYYFLNGAYFGRCTDYSGPGMSMEGDLSCTPSQLETGSMGKSYRYPCIINGQPSPE